MLHLELQCQTFGARIKANGERHYSYIINKWETAILIFLSVPAKVARCFFFFVSVGVSFFCLVLFFLIKKTPNSAGTAFPLCVWLNCVE